MITGQEFSKNVEKVFFRKTDPFILHSRIGIQLARFQFWDCFCSYCWYCVLLFYYPSFLLTLPSVLSTAGRGEACTEAHPGLPPRDRDGESVA